MSAVGRPGWIWRGLGVNQICWGRGVIKKSSGNLESCSVLDPSSSFATVFGLLFSDQHQTFSFCARSTLAVKGFTKIATESSSIQGEGEFFCMKIFFFLFVVFLVVPLLIAVTSLPTVVHFYSVMKLLSFYNLSQTEKKSWNCLVSQTALKPSNTHNCCVQPAILSVAFMLISVNTYIVQSLYFVCIFLCPGFIFSLFTTPSGSSPSFQMPQGFLQNFAHLNAVCPPLYQNTRNWHDASTSLFIFCFSFATHSHKTSLALFLYQLAVASTLQVISYLFIPMCCHIETRH